MVESFDIDPATAVAGNWLKGYRVPQCFIANPSIFDAIKRHRYWRFDVEISIRLTSTRYHTGGIIGAYFPNIDNGGSSAYMNMVNASQMPSCMIDVTDGGVAVVECKCLIPYRVMDMDFFTGDIVPNPFYMGAFLIGAVTNIGHPDNAKIGVQVWARAKNIVCDGPCLLQTFGSSWVFTPPTTIPLKDMSSLPSMAWPMSYTLNQDEPLMELQMNAPSKEQKAKCKTLATTAPPETANFIASAAFIPTTGFMFFSSVTITQPEIA